MVTISSEGGGWVVGVGVQVIAGYPMHGQGLAWPPETPQSLIYQRLSCVRSMRKINWPLGPENLLINNCCEKAHKKMLFLMFDINMETVIPAYSTKKKKISKCESVTRH